MARTTAPKPETQDPIEAEILAADAGRITQEGEAELAAADEQRMLSARRERELDRVAGDLPDDVNALWMFTEHSMIQEAVSGLDAGRGLLKLKEKLPHGEFMAGLDQRGIPARTARRKMAIAVRFAERTEKFLKLGRTKLYACLEFSDDELQALDEGESVLDLTLDDLDRMTSRELREALKKARADGGVKDKLLADKNQRIDELATENERRAHMPAPDAGELVRDIKAEKVRALAAIGVISMRIDCADPSTITEQEFFALQVATEELRNEVAHAFRGIWEIGGRFQASIDMAMAPSDADAHQ